MKRMAVVLADEALYAAAKREAARRKRSLTDLVTEALREWLEAQEDAEWQPSLNAARAEWRDQGGTEAAEFFGQLKGESHDSSAP